MMMSGGSVNIDGYDIERLIYESAGSVVYRAVHRASKVSCIIKILNVSAPSAPQVARFRREFDIQSSYESASVPRVRDFIQVGRHPAIVMEDTGLVALSEVLLEEAWTLHQKLSFAVHLSTALMAVHDQHVVHKDINPGNILTSRDGSRVQIIDFGISSVLAEESGRLNSSRTMGAGEFEGTLAYMAPEQTGRISRSVDQRSDLYGLGATLYEVFVGHRMFSMRDAMDLVHAHLAKKPPSAHEALEEIPPIVSDILVKLLEKNGDDRYQSAKGLRVDFQRCLDDMLEEDCVRPFPIAEMDVSSQLRVPDRLLGRAENTDRLLALFDLVILSGQAGFVSVTGESGIGKTAVVKEIEQSAVAKSGVFVSGKYDQYQQDQPYSAILEALSDSLELLMVLPEAEISTWQMRLRDCVGDVGKLLTDVLPRLELLIGPQPAVTDLSGQEARERFRYVLRQLVQALSQYDRPLVLFLDDMQWADQASLEFLYGLITAPDPTYLFIIWAYRDNEVGADHPLQGVLSSLDQAGRAETRLHLEGLTAQDVTQLVAETLHTTADRVTDFAALVHQKTRGNPFFIRQFIASLLQDRVIWFDDEQGVWQWDQKGLSEYAATGNVVEFMTQRLGSMGHDTGQVLGIGACVGQSFHLWEVMIGSQLPLKSLVRALWPALAEGILIPLNTNYRTLKMENIEGLEETIQQARFKFAHDRIQQAAQELLTPTAVQDVHHKLGLTFLETWRENPSSHVMYRVVAHLNEAPHLLEDLALRREIALLNLQASYAARRSAAFRASLSYVQAGLGLLSEQNWETDYILMRDLVTNLVEAAVQVGNHDLVMAWVEVMNSRAHSVMDRVPVAEFLMEYHMYQQEADAALDVGIALLKDLGLNLPRYPSTLRVVRELLAFKAAFKSKTYHDLTSLPDMKDERIRAQVSIMQRLISATYVANQYLFVLFTVGSIRLSLRHGFHPSTPLAYATYGILLVQKPKTTPRGIELGQAALAYVDRPDVRPYAAKVHFIVHLFLVHWQQDFSYIPEKMLMVHRLALETGDRQNAAYSLQVYLMHRFYAGVPLSTLIEEMKRYNDQIVALGQDTSVNILAPYFQATLNLINEDETPYLLSGPLCSFNEAYNLNQTKRNDAALYAVIQTQMMLGLWLQRADVAEGLTYRIQKVGSIYGKISEFYSALLDVDEAQLKTGLGKRRSMRRVQKVARRFKQYAVLQPSYYRCQYLVLKAEIAILANASDQADNLFREALERVRDTDFVHLHALIAERTARFYLRQNRADFAGMYFRQAVQMYSAWGAVAKVNQLQAEFKTTDLLSVPPMSVPPMSETPGSQLLKTVSDQTTGLSMLTGSGQGEFLDMEALFRASNAITSEIRVPELMKALMETVLAAAGAEKTILILSGPGGWLIQARLDEAGIQVMENLSLTPDQIATQIVNLTLRSGEATVVGNATQDTRFLSDPYILARQPKSIMCLPLMNKAEVKGALYLENNLSSGAFTDNRVKVLSLLSGQVAVALDNARLYEESQRINRELEVLNKTLNQQVDIRTQEVREKSELMSSIFANMQDGMAVIDAEGHVLSWNAQLVDLYGLPDDLMQVGANHMVFWDYLFSHDVLEATSVQLVRQTLAQLPGLEASQNEWVLELTDGQFTLCRVRRMPNGLWVALHQDITDQRQQAEDLHQAKTDAEQANLEKSQFLATMSHEIRTPMNGVLGILEVLYGTELSHEQVNLIDVMSDSAKTLLLLIDDILDFSKIEAGKLDVDHTPTELRPVIEGAVDLLALKAQEKGLLLQSVISADVPSGAQLDAGRLRQILINLVGNAVKFTEAGTIWIQVSVEPAVDGMNAPQSTLRFEVHDTGIGMSQDEVGKLFQPFAQADVSTTRRFGGTGLGLTICRKLCEMMGGQIGVESSIGQGSTFWFTLPLHAVELEAVELEAVHQTVPDLKDVRLLVVGGDHRLQDAVLSVLSQYELDVTLFDDPTTAMAALKSAYQHKTPYQIILHIQPDISGGDCGFYQELAQNSETSDIATICVSPIPGLCAKEGTSDEAFKADISLGFPLNHRQLRPALMRAIGVMDEFAAPQSRGRVKYQAPPPDVAETAGSVILIAEDNRTNQLVVRHQMARLGMVVDVVSNGQEALDRLRTHPSRYALVFTDCHMPVMDGYSLTTIARETSIASSQGGRLPIFALTANVVAGEAQRCLDVGMDGYLSKPVSMHDLDAVLTQHAPIAIELRQSEDFDLTNAVMDAPREAKGGVSEAPSVLDITFIEDIFGSVDDEAKYMLNFFLQTTAETLTKLIDAPDTATDEMRELAHKAAGAAHTAGAKALAQHLNAIEEDIIGGRLAEALARRPLTMDVFAETRAAIEAL